MSTSTSLISQVAEELKIPFSFLDAEKSVLILHFPKKNHFVINNKLGLLTNAEEQLGKDKGYQYLLLKDHIQMPKTKMYLDVNSRYGEFAEFTSHNQIVNDILKHFSFPFILKRNQGSEGSRVFKVNSRAELEEKVEVIFSQQDSEYDYVLLAQAYIAAIKEYRVVIYDQKIVLTYLKDTSNAEFNGNLSPLHWESARAVEVTEDSQLEKINAFVQKMFSSWPVQFAGLDVIEDPAGRLWLLEVNTAPALAYFVKDNGTESVLKIYKKFLLDLQARYS